MSTTNLTRVPKSRLLCFINLVFFLVVTIFALIRLGLIVDFVVYLLVMLVKEWIVDPLKILLEVVKWILQLPIRSIALLLSSINVLLLWTT